MKKAVRITLVAIITLVIVLQASHYIITGFCVRTDVGLEYYSVSEDGSEIILRTSIWSSMGFTRGFKDDGGGAKPHYLTFYSTFGGLNSKFGAQNEHILKLDPGDNEIYFNRQDSGYELVLKKDETGKWIRP